MVMRPLKKSTLREIKKSLGRYLAIMAIMALGVGFFCGLRICKPAMLSAAQQYIDEHRMFDYRLISTLGFTSEDPAYFAALHGVKAAEGAVYADVLCAGTDGGNRALRVHSITENVNQLSLTAGRMPENDREAVVDARYMDASAIGTQFTLSPDNTQDTLDQFRYSSYTIVGLANSVYYLNYERGNTSLGSGSISGFVYIPYGGFNLDYYSEIFVDLDTVGSIYSDEYNACLDDFEAMIERECEKRSDLRYRSLVEEAQQEIDDAQSELDEKYDEFTTEKSDAQQQLKDVHAELEDAEQQIADGERELSQNSNKLSDARSSYRSGRSQYEKAVQEFERQRDAVTAQFDAAQQQLDSQRAEVQAGIDQIEASGVPAQYAQLEAAETQVTSGIETLESQRSAQTAQLQAAIDEASAAISSADDAISTAQSSCDAAVDALQAQISALDGNISAWNGQISALDPSDEAQAAEIADLKSRISAAEGEKSALSGQIDSAKADAAAQISALQAQRSELEGTLTTLQAQLTQANAAFDAQRAELDEQASEIAAGKAAIEASGVLSQYQTAKAGLAQLDAAQTELDNQRTAAQAELDGYQAQLDATGEKLDSARRQIRQGEAQLSEGQQQLDDAKQALETGLSDYDAAFVESEQQLSDAEEQLADAQQEIDDAQAQVDELEPATLYVLGRDTNVGYICFESDSQIVQGVSTVFPLFFLLVAALVCMTTMTRMVDEQRTVIGTLKALGYGRGAILSKYLFYSGSAALLGALIGFFGGSYIFPKIIWMTYGMMYGFAPIPYVLSPLLGSLSVGAALLCSMGATWLSCGAELADVPAQLIRPKAPKPGRRILLERVGFIWRRLSFLTKVALRNTFRYKKRLLMMIVGISGCTALMVTGLGINDSIANLPDDQFGKIMVYDASVGFIDPQDSQAQADFRNEMDTELSDALFVYEGSADVAFGTQTRSVNIIISDRTDISDFIRLHSGETALDFPNEGECIVNTGLAQRLGAQVGDTLTVYNAQMERMTLHLSGIFDNYVYNYLIVDSASVAGQWASVPECNTAFVNFAEGQDAGETGAHIAGLETVSNVSVSAEVRGRFENMMSSLNAIVVMVILCAAALAFIVLFNLTNINITERIREIATVKVLGFTLRETAAYVLSENFALSALAALVGLPLGKLLHSFVMTQIRVDLVVFDVRVLPLSYGLAVALTLLFAALVNAAMLRRINRIPMAESLKTVE